MHIGWKRIPAVIACLTALLATATPAQETAAKQKAQADTAPGARSKDGKKLFSAADAVRVARVSSPRVSPDGTRVAYLVAENRPEKDQPGKYVTHVWVVPSAGPPAAARQYTREEKSAANLAWSPDGQLLAFTMEAGDDKDSKPQVWFMYVNGGEPWQVTKHKSGVRGFQFSPDGKTLLLTAIAPPTDDEEKRKKNKDDAVVVDHDLKPAHLWTWDVATGEEKQVTKGDFSDSDPRWSPDGRRITFTSRPSPLEDDSSRESVWVLDVATGTKRPLSAYDGSSSAARWSADGRLIAFLGQPAPFLRKVDLFVVDASGAEPRKLTGTFDLDAGAPHWSADGAHIYFSTEDHEAERVFVADVAGGTVKALTPADRVVALADVGGKTAVGTVTDPAHPEDVFHSDLTFASLDKITDHNAWLTGYALGAVEVVKWKSSKDGLEIDGIVTKPVDWDAGRKSPFLLYPHGGPTGVSSLSFGIATQVMAANGYMLLQPNFRGSNARGEAFQSANQHDWGGGDYQDDMSGVQAMVDRGWADPDRLGAFGWSYGGYMTMWIDTQTDRFKAISPGAGLPDLYSMYSQTDIHRYLAVFHGSKTPWENYEEYWAHSPMKYVANVKTPTMILHGQADTRVPMPQGDEFYRALHDLHVPVEYVTYPRENHGFVEPRHIEDRLQRYLVFFGKYLNNPPVTEPTAIVEHMSRDLPQ